jgi:hypothetical protein
VERMQDHNESRAALEILISPLLAYAAAMKIVLRSQGSKSSIVEFRCI